MARIALALGAVAVVLVALAGYAMWTLWPHAAPPAAQDAPPEQHAGLVRSAEGYECPMPLPESHPDRARGNACQLVSIEVMSGPEAGTTVELDTAEGGYPAFRAGDRVVLDVDETPDGTREYDVAGFERRRPLMILGAVFLVAMLLVGRLRGLRALVGLALSLLVIVIFMVPALMAGRNPVAVAVVGAFAVMVVTLYFSHGLNVKTIAALIGTSMSLALTTALGLTIVDAARITGYASEEMAFVRNAIGGMDVRGLMLAGLLIGAVGVFNNAAVEQASTAFMVDDAQHRRSWREVFHRAMAAGRDRIAAVVNTLVFAYLGASIVLVAAFSAPGVSVVETLTSEVVAQQIVIMLVASAGLVCAVPVTTALAAWMAVRRPRPEPAPVPSTDIPAPTRVSRHVSPPPRQPRQPRTDVSDLDLSEEEQDQQRWARFLEEARADDA